MSLSLAKGLIFYNLLCIFGDFFLNLEPIW